MRADRAETGVPDLKLASYKPPLSLDGLHRSTELKGDSVAHEGHTISQSNSVVLNTITFYL